MNTPIIHLHTTVLNLDSSEMKSLRDTPSPESLAEPEFNICCKIISLLGTKLDSLPINK
jgi:hypothetical protein